MLKHNLQRSDSANRVTDMGPFFHGWRRKLGGMVLLLALFMVAAWSRSFAIIDTVSLSNGPTYQHVACEEGRVQWCRFDNQQLPPGTKPKFTWVSGPMYLPPWAQTRGVSVSLPLEPTASDITMTLPLYPRDRPWYGVTFRRHDFGKQSLTELTIPHWMIVVPLTAVSAVLILRKPRQRAGRYLTEQ